MECLEVKSPKCTSMCGVEVEERELVEDMQTGEYEVQCDVCGCEFSFDVCVEILNKKTVKE